jgi:hypothetical protein
MMSSSSGRVSPIWLVNIREYIVVYGVCIYHVYVSTLIPSVCEIWTDDYMEHHDWTELHLFTIATASLLINNFETT